MALRSELSRWLSISVLSCALTGALVGCGQTGPLYLPPEPDEPEEEVDTVIDAETSAETSAETGAEAGLEAGIQAGREGDLMENPNATAATVATPDDTAVDSDVIIETVDDSGADAVPVE